MYLMYRSVSTAFLSSGPLPDVGQSTASTRPSEIAACSSVHKNVVERTPGPGQTSGTVIVYVTATIPRMMQGTEPRGEETSDKIQDCRWVGVRADVLFV